jgi:hypothetical protein
VGFFPLCFEGDWTSVYTVYCKIESVCLQKIMRLEET